MHSNLIRVAVFGVKALPHEPVSHLDAPPYEATDFDVKCYEDDRTLQRIMRYERPDVILTIGDWTRFNVLSTCSYEVRRRWIHRDTITDPVDLGVAIMNCYIGSTFPDVTEKVLVSVITPTFRTGEKIHRPYSSLLAQTYTNWEWVIVDDSDHEHTYRQLKSMAEADHRISLYRASTPCGVIGEMKYRASMLAKGEYIVELDHDDELTNRGLEYIVDAFKRYPEGGFAYTDCAETHEGGGGAWYKEGWGFGFGSYRTETYNGSEHYVTNYPRVNAITARHIVGMPNHIRAWRKSTYMEIGGHNRNIHVCDDYELMIRTFLKTRMLKIPKFGYIQYYNKSGNTQRKRNAEIQRLVRYFRNHYDRAIHERILELGMEDFMWNEEKGHCDFATPKPYPDDQHCDILVE